MGVDPDASNLLWLPASINLRFKELSHGNIIERYERLGALLLYEPDVPHTQQIIGLRDAEPTDFGGAEVTQVEQLGPRRWAEPQRGSLCLAFAAGSSQVASG